MSDRPDGGAIAGILTGALIGVTVAMALAPSRTGRPAPPESGELLSRGRKVLDAATAGLAPLGAPAAGSDPSPSSAGA